MLLYSLNGIKSNTCPVILSTAEHLLSSISLDIGKQAYFVRHNIKYEQVSSFYVYKKK